VPPESLAPCPNLDDFCDKPEPEYDWIVPDALERADRLILTGSEGSGKSTFLRQIGTQVSQGIHPFGGSRFDPVTVLLVDLENSERHLRRKLRELRLTARKARGDDFDPARLLICARPKGIDLLEPYDVEWLCDGIQTTRPDILIVGPSYKMAGGDPTSEEVARCVAGTLDRIRVDYSMAILMEAHVPYAQGGGKRPQRPYGASLWSRWPEFGLHLGDNGALSHWRSQRDERAWPTKLERGGDWPWTPANADQVIFARVIEVTRERGKKVSVRDLESAIGGSKSGIDRIIRANKVEYDALLAELGL
jgi:energy-coupling factor transporter ATP-binding protein EcfA2